MSNRRKAGKKKASEGLVREAVQDITSRVTGIYVFLMFFVFPLFVTDKYYNVLKDKYYFFFYATLACAVICLTTWIISVIGKKKQKPAEEGKTFFQKAGEFFTGLWKKLTLTDKFFYGFILVVLISTAFSEWPYEAFWGNMGRLQGCFFFLIVSVSYFMVSRLYRFRRLHLYALLLSGLLLTLWGITDYLGLDIMGYRADAGNTTEILTFTSSIGNINTYTGIVALYAGAAAVLCIISDKWYLAFPSMFIFVMGLVTGVSDNAVLCMAAVYGLLPFSAFRSKKGVIRYLFLVATALFAMGVSAVLTNHWTLTVTTSAYPWLIGVLMDISFKFTKVLLIAGALLCGAAAALHFVWKDTPDFKTNVLIKIWGFFFAAVFAAVVALFVVSNTKGVPEPLKGYENILVFDDRWGTNRGFAWKYLFYYFSRFPLHKKLFGSGPETYSIFMAKNHYYEMKNFMDAVFDSPHSEALQYLFTTGILGFLTYYGAVVSASVRGIRAGKTAYVFAFALIGATAASLINISVPITTPLVFMSMAIAGSIIESEETD